MQAAALERALQLLLAQACGSPAPERTGGALLGGHGRQAAQVVAKVVIHWHTPARTSGGMRKARNSAFQGAGSADGQPEFGREIGGGIPALA